MPLKSVSANGTWADVALADTSIGYGPAANREYELTILDGKVYMAKPNGEQVKMRHDPRPDEGFAMLQLASPKAWVEHDELAQINSFDDLNFELDQVVDDLGCDDRVLLPFMIKGHASSMTWSMDTQPIDRATTTADEDVVIVGLYNRLHKQKYFMVRGYNLHAHVVFPTLDQAGHVRNPQLDGGARLYLPTE